ncbi:DUF2124 family protein [uncultured Methanomethylovorans sp.]|uniref:DUF2124 family protein n=1 Tax=uncultured Methanomethylovorans sp. TaxID=183759 RepID=UPI002AA7D61A|nr:DUF2124 family protein [uncultured Methanomethylovorans sp.]
MDLISTSKGIGGQLVAFKEVVKESKSIVFMGSGFCTPFAELLAYGLRESDKKLIFISNTDSESARSIIAVPQGYATW